MDSSRVVEEHSYASSTYKPLYLQRVESSLNLNRFVKATERFLADLDFEDSSDSEVDETIKTWRSSLPPGVKFRTTNGITTDAEERSKFRISRYRFGDLKKSQKWLQDVLQSDSDSSDYDDDDDSGISEQRLQDMLREHQLYTKYKARLATLPSSHSYLEYTKSILEQGPFPEPRPPKKKVKSVPDAKVVPNSLSANSTFEDELEDGEIVLPFGYSDLDQLLPGKESPELTNPSSAPTPPPKVKGKKPLTQEVLLARRKKLWHALCKKDVPKAAKTKMSIKKDLIANARKCAIAVMKLKRKEAIASQKAMKDTQSRMRRATREMSIYWKRFEKVEKQQLRKVQKEAQEQRKADLELLEAKRQMRKLNFLITQTELYAHFMARKITGASDTEKMRILGQLEEADKPSPSQSKLTQIQPLSDEDDYDADVAKEEVLHNVEEAIDLQRGKTKKFDITIKAHAAGNLGLSQADLAPGQEYPQPSIFEGKLKSYQIKGMNWIANLYSSGINGILADEMGLGKTVQSIAFLAHLAEVHGIWGPFLVVAPASTLHNWQQECSRFVPTMRVVPYWGTTQERKILRKFWDQQNLHTEQASFHIVITSYQLVIQDCKYFQKISWHYMILDEAQALKSSTSNRWKILLDFNCRNRLLLTGTPIQNSMAELWALLHFIMPTMFDSHDEFNEWFSKDIENHVENKSNIDQNHLSRLHMILKPFMLRRIKKDVENDLTDKIEILMYCPLTIRQRYLYDAIKRKIRIEDLLQSAGANSTAQATSSTNSLMNLVMQFRKVCNHPELFERRDIKSPLVVSIEPYHLPKLIYRDGMLSHSLPSQQHIVYRMFYLHNADYTHHSTLRAQDRNSLFCWLRLFYLSEGELFHTMRSGLLQLLRLRFRLLQERSRVHNEWRWSDNRASLSSFSRRRILQIGVEHPTDPSNLKTSPVLCDMVFTSFTSTACSHIDHSLFYMQETPAHRKIRLRQRNAAQEPSSPCKEATSGKKRHHLPKPTLTAKSSAQLEPIENGESIHTEERFQKLEQEEDRLCRVSSLVLTDMPRFLNHMIPKAISPSHHIFCSDRSAEYERMLSALCGTLEDKNFLRCGPARRDSSSWCYQPAGSLEAVRPYYGFSNVFIPDKKSMIVDAGKMHVLDELLMKLKKEGHRVLIYSTMTKVIDLLEEFMWYRRHRYMRLDGSSKISDRRDMVSDFQSKSDIFVFLLSTRAGGLGINLTAADTVIFYDSDWNPTVDAQAMDRAHRLGQTKQVTVYRLICKGTIEERILERAREKSEIQRMVISGHNTFKPDVLKPKEVVSLLIDDDSLKRRLQQAQYQKHDKAVKRKAEKAALKAAQAVDGPIKAKKPRKNGPAAREQNVVIAESATYTSTTNSPAAPENNESMDELEHVDVLDESSIASSPMSSAPASSAPPTPSIGNLTPTITGKRKRGRPKGSRSTKPVVRMKGGLKKALTAAEIAGARAGMTAAYAAYGYNVVGNVMPSRDSQSPMTTPKS